MALLAIGVRDLECKKSTGEKSKPGSFAEKPYVSSLTNVPLLGSF